jgi:GNAT superfamily N-acetyltransferase/predicted GNAT family acetyltransferase
MSLSLQSAVEFPAETLVDLLNRAFTGYVGGDAQFTVPAFEGFTNRDGTNLVLSQVVLVDETPIGLGLVARRGWASRLAAMGVVPEATGTGVGTWFMNELIDQARERGDREYWLECIEQNPRGVKLYKRAGFRVETQLLGYTLAQPDGGSHMDLAELDVPAVAKQIVRHGLPHLPWQLSGWSLVQQGPPTLAFHLDDAYAIISPPNRDMIVIHALIVPTEKRRQGQATRLLRALFTRFPEKTWYVVPVVPVVLRPFFQSLGFDTQAISQVLMRLPL